MGRKAICFLLGLCAFATGCSNGETYEKKTVANLPDKEIRDLSYAIKTASTYRDDMRSSLDSLEVALDEAISPDSAYALTLELARRLRPINTDSSLYYATRAQAMAVTLDQDKRDRAGIAIVDALSTAGLFTEAVELFDCIEEKSLSPTALTSYWLAGRRLYGYMKSYAQGNEECAMKYDRLYQQYDDSLLRHLPEKSNLRAFIESERLVTMKKYREAQAQLETLLAMLPQKDNLYGMAAYQMAEVWKNLGYERRYASMLAVSALSDVKGCVTEGLALPTLADWLYKQGKFGEAFAFINFALEEASAGNARMRAVTIARFVPLIDDAYRDKINSSRDELMIYFLLVTFFCVVTIILIIILRKQMRQTRTNAMKLEMLSRRQESYIGNFIGLYSSYADRLNHLTRVISAKLATGQIAELKKLLESGRFSDEENDDIHKRFDSAFLDIYPDFVEKLNALLRPEEQISLKEGKEGLTPELRIYALVKLGVDESARIAQILHYSSNTVYAYRNKMRNKSIRRESFDADVKAL